MNELLETLAKYNCQVEQIDGKIIITPKEVEQPKQPKFKRGDILISLHDGMLCIFDSYCDDFTFTSLYNTSRFADVNWCTDCFRLANEEEKQFLFDKLKEDGKRWNEETCEIETFKWKPSFGEIYYYVDYRIAFSEFYVNFTYNREWSIDDSMIEQGKCFKTEEECQKKCDKLNDAIKKVR